MPRSSPSRLPPEFVDRHVGEWPRRRHVLEAASQRVVVAHRRPIDAQRRVDGRLDILRVHVAVLRPAVIDGVASLCVGLANRRPALDAAAGEEAELLRPVIPAACRGDRPHRPPEFAVHHDQRLVEKPVNRGKILTAEDLDRLGGFVRYKDVDGDGVGWRTLPGTHHPKAVCFTRGSGHNEKAQYTEREDDYINNMDRLVHKFEIMRQHSPEPVVSTPENAKIGFVAWGTSDYAVRESCDQLKAEHGIEASYLRLRAYPFTGHLLDFIRGHDRVYVVDQNRDGQLLGLMRLELDAELIAKLRSLRYYGGLPLDARTVTDHIIAQEGK